MGRGSGPRRAFNWEVGETMARSNINATRVLLSIVVGIPSLFFLLFSLLGSFFFPPFLRFGPKLGEKSSRVGWIGLPLPSCYNDREREISFPFFLAIFRKSRATDEEFEGERETLRSRIVTREDLITRGGRN